MPYSWLSDVLDLTQMVMDIWRQLETTVFIIYHNICFNNIVKKPFPGTPLGDALLLSVRGTGPHPEGHGHLGTTENGLLIINYNSHFVNFYQNCLPVASRLKKGSNVV